MDDLDFKIFKAIDFRPFGPTSGDLSRLNPWVIAKKVGADGATVKLRLDKMKRSGFIQYFQIYPNFRLLGLEAVSYEFDLPDVLGKSAVIEKCALVDGVIEIHNFIGPTICIDFVFADGQDEDRRLGLFRHLTGCPAPEKFYERDMPPVDIELTPADWRIVKALRYNALKPLSEVAREIGLSPKTVRRRFERMANHGAVIVVPVVDPSNVPHTITYVLLLYPTPTDRDSVVTQAVAELGSSTFLSRIAPPGNAFLCLAARTLAESEENLLRARRIPGMKDVKLLVLREIREYTKWLDSAIDRKISETSRVAESPVP
ncbi:MAG TPA: winged helix-turn-helix transcriptional regulator [Thermoplasmata archaeon]|nr:winged helix-turn-helix transcriptional regulator [Thermoplasmata archaeon]